MGTDDSEAWQPQSRVGAVVAALIVGDAEAAERAAEELQADTGAEADAEADGVASPADDKEPLVLAAAIRLAVRSLFDEDTPPDLIAEYVAAMARDIEVDQDIAQALIQAQLDDGTHGLDTYPPQEVIDTTWSVFGYLCERRLGRDDSLELIAQAEQEAL